MSNSLHRSSSLNDYPDFVMHGGMRLSVTARISTKARTLRVLLHNHGVLEVVMPKSRLKAQQSLKCEQIEALLEEKRAWIERTAQRIAPHIEAYRQGMAAGLPSHLELPVFSELWRVSYHATPATRITTKMLLDTRLLLHGPIEDEELCFEALRRFLTSYAKKRLPSFAWRIAGELERAGQLPHRPAHITVSHRKSAWGVCTHDARIRIDRRVIFLPYDLARQVVLHELAHLAHLNHSKAFYEELYSYDGSTREAEHTLKQASLLVPAWF